MEDESKIQKKRVKKTFTPAILIWLIIIGLAVIAGFSSFYIV